MLNQDDDGDDDNELQLVTSQLSLRLIIHWLLCDKVIMKQYNIALNVIFFATPSLTGAETMIYISSAGVTDFKIRGSFWNKPSFLARGRQSSCSPLYVVLLLCLTVFFALSSNSKTQ